MYEWVDTYSTRFKNAFLLLHNSSVHPSSRSTMLSHINCGRNEEQNRWNAQGHGNPGDCTFPLEVETQPTAKSKSEPELAQLGHQLPDT